MIILNYHGVNNSIKPDFYTISPAQLANHLAIIRRLGLRAISTLEVMEAKQDGGIVMLHFDDGTCDHCEIVAPLLNQAGMKGVFFVSTNKSNKERYLSVEQIKSLAADGHSIESHGHTHHRLDKLTAEELDHELATSVTLITDWTGRAPSQLAPPGGYFNDAVIQAAKRHGMKITRTMRWSKVTIPIRDKLDCFVVTQSTSDKQIQMWLEERGLGITLLSYYAKQVIRCFLPSRLYLGVRRLLGSKSNHLTLYVAMALGLATASAPLSPMKEECLSRITRRTIKIPRNGYKNRIMRDLALQFAHQKMS